MQFSDQHYLTRIQRLGIHWYETLGSSFQGGLEVGYLNMLQNKNPQPAAQFAAGEYAGLLFRFLVVNKNAFAFNINLNYRYNKTKGTSASQETKFSWYETLLVNELHYKLLDNMNLLLAAEFQHIDGNLRSTNISTVKTFKTDKPYGVRVGIKYHLSRTEVIGFDWLTGYKTGGKIYFGRNF